ncbi:hypothetical protein B0A75_14815 [Flavobacterium oncorhynchi]|uniref:Uncharacterized protein n=1 Tax=Flavobacterium oncorhynchi TaxID=728056 RepID=A0A226HVE1_9FLAO|nr:hypothetical protein [Flavobacterium oncorhynchi]OXA98213.1 hypothetical protein B0A75_14815 [Flavobacterium oncorhynchi]
MEQYCKLMNEYSGTELFKEIIHFMDMSFPEWKTNRGLGFTSLEFVRHSIDFLSQCNLEKNEKVFNIGSLKIIYLSLVEDYERFKTEYKLVFSSFVLDRFTAEYADEIEDEYLTDFRYNYLYDIFLKQEFEKVTYDFQCK